MILASDPQLDTIFGKVTPPPGTPAGANPVDALGNLLGVGLQLVVLVAMALMFIYLMIGAFDWITSGGEKEKIVKAQNKIINAVIGIILVIAAFTVFILVNGKVFDNKFVDVTDPANWKIKIPQVQP